jgi:hypothetical protein
LLTLIQYGPNDLRLSLGLTDTAVSALPTYISIQTV